MRAILEQANEALRAEIDVLTAENRRWTVSLAAAKAEIETLNNGLRKLETGHPVAEKPAPRKRRAVPPVGLGAEPSRHRNPPPRPRKYDWDIGVGESFIADVPQKAMASMASTSGKRYGRKYATRGLPGDRTEVTRTA